MADVNLSLEEREQLARLVMDIFEDWRLTTEQQFSLLGLDEDSSPRLLTKYRHGKAFPEEEDILERAKHVLGIQHALHVVFPLNPKMPVFWLKNRNRQLKAPPLRVMLNEGIDGMHRVWRSLDCTLNWD